VNGKRGFAVVHETNLEKAESESHERYQEFVKAALDWLRLQTCQIF
jgi:hypothetical protein